MRQVPQTRRIGNMRSSMRAISTKSSENTSFWGSARLRSRRDATRVIYEILLLVSNGASRTRISSKANLNFRRTQEYLSFLKIKGFVIDTAQDKGVSSRFWLTVKGERFLQFLSQVEKELCELFASSPASAFSVENRFGQNLQTPDMRQVHALIETQE